MNELLRLIPALVGLFALTAAVPSAAQVGSGRIAYAGDGTGIYTVAPDGTDLQRVKSGYAFVPRWSPDGSKLAFIEHLEGDHGPAVALKVMNADGTGEHVVATADWPQGNWLSSQPWSPDGSRIAWSQAGPYPGDDIYTASAAGGDVRRLTTDGAPKDPPVWSPAGQQLAYSSQGELFLARDDGSASVPLTPGFTPSWSPDGTSIAFVTFVAGEDTIFVVHPDGTNLRRLWVPPHGLFGFFVPTWSPDGSEIAYPNTLSASCKGCPGGQEIWLVNVDGSGVRQLTTAGSPPLLIADGLPAWSPDGDRIVFTSSPDGALATMNPDGTCQEWLHAAGATDIPSWQAVPGGPPLGRKTCPAALALNATRTPNGDGSAATIHAAIANEGTEPLTNVMLTISAPKHDVSFDLSGAGCTRQTEGLFCEIDRLGAGESRDLAGLGLARRVGLEQDSSALPVRVRLQAIASSASGSQQAIGELFFTPRRCRTLDPGSGSIYGTRFADQVCGRGGADEIHPGRGQDFVSAGAGRDVIFARDGARDLITCGRGRDLVIADRIDKVSRSCERVRRGRYR